MGGRATIKGSLLRVDHNIANSGEDNYFRFERGRCGLQALLGVLQVLCVKHIICLLHIFFTFHIICMLPMKLDPDTI